MQTIRPADRHAIRGRGHVSRANNPINSTADVPASPDFLDVLLGRLSHVGTDGAGLLTFPHSCRSALRGNLGFDGGYP